MQITRSHRDVLMLMLMLNGDVNLDTYHDVDPDVDVMLMILMINNQFGTPRLFFGIPDSDRNFCV